LSGFDPTAHRQELAPGQRHERALSARTQASTIKKPDNAGVSLRNRLLALSALGVICYAVFLWLGVRDSISVIGMLNVALALLVVAFVASFSETARFWGYGVVVAAVSASFLAFLTFLCLAAIFAPGSFA
jgi:hypothetical protein